MKIIETKLGNFGSMSVRKTTRRIILHHAAAKKCSAQDIHRWHKDRGWSGAGYHFLVRKDGKIYRLRPEKYVGAHASGNNSDSLGICFEGDFEKESMTNAQKNAGRQLVSYLKNKYGISKVQRHKDVGSTSCPGKNFPFGEIVKRAEKEEVEQTGKPEKPSTDEEELKVDGYWGPKLTRRLQKIFGTQVDGVVSNQFSCYRAENPGLDEGWEWQSSPSGYSPLIKAIQKKVGAKQDGHLGPDTIRAIQKWLGCIQDGCFSKKSPSIKKLQQWCNKQ